MAKVKCLPAFPKFLCAAILYKLSFEEKFSRVQSRVFQPEKKSVVCIKYKMASKKLDVMKWMVVMYF